MQCRGSAALPGSQTCKAGFEAWLTHNGSNLIGSLTSGFPGQMQRLLFHSSGHLVTGGEKRFKFNQEFSTVF